MFKVALVRTITWPVQVEIPQDGGKTQKAGFDAELEILSQEEHDELIRDGGDVLARTFRGAKRLQDESGQPLECTDAVRQQLLGISYVRVALLKAYYEAFHGRRAERKNG